MRFCVLVAALLCAQCSNAGVSAGYSSSNVTSYADAHQPVSEGYGATGSFGMNRVELDNPHWSGEPISVFLPKGPGGGGKHPTLFFCHAFGATSWERGYTDLMGNLVSHGYTVVYVPYQTLRTTPEEKYEALWAGFLAAVERHGSRMDLERVGFVGHSFGGGAAPAMAHRGFVDKGWGERGRFLFIMAPWYSYNLGEKELGSFPRNTRVTVQVYDRDDVNDHRMAIDLFENLGLPSENKVFQLIRSHAHNGSEAVADHVLPGKNPYLALKSWGVFRQIHALAEFVFEGDEQAGRIAAGTGGSEQTEMGTWNDGTPYPPLVILDRPTAAESEGHYKFPWTNERNPRSGDYAEDGGTKDGPIKRRLKERFGRK